MTDTQQQAPSVALIGGTGGMGSYVLQELVRRGLPARVVIRRPGAIEATDLLTPVVADAYDTTALTKALAGTHTVVSAFNPGWNETSLYERYGLGARNVQEAAVAADVVRLLVIGGASSLYDDDGRQLIEAGLPPEPYGSGVRAARDYLETISAEHRVDWVFLSPPTDCGPMGPTGRTGHYRVGANHPVRDADGRNAISREDLALAVVDEVVMPTHHGVRFTVGY